MKAMILAAGLGQRMRPLTDHLPKPLLCAGGKPLLQYHLENLAANGIQEVIINLAYLGDKIRAFVGDGQAFNLKVTYSDEPEPLETGGALLHAAEHLGDEPFLLINGDVWSDYPLAQLKNHPLRPDTLAHLILVVNPDFHPQGDFAIDSTGRLINQDGSTSYTFSGISLIHPRMIQTYPHRRTKFPLVEVFRYEIERGGLTAEVYTGRWSDVGTPERLSTLDRELKEIP